MDKSRAQEIASSPVMAHVTHHGTQVYIEGVDEKSETAQVYHLKNPEQRHKVHVNDLEESDTFQ